MRKIAVINQKGGVGKTTTAANLGAALARAGRRVLLIDLDPQGHLGLHFGIELGDDQPTIYDVLVDETPLGEVIVEAADGLFVAPSNIDLAGAETELVSVLGREVLLRDALAQHGDDFDCMLIDCPPSLGVLTINALVAVDELLIPLQAQFFALQGFSKLLDKTVRLVCQRINPELRVLGVVLCMHESNTRLSNEVAEDIASFLEASRGTPTAWSDAKVFDAYIRRNIKLAEASSFGQSVFEYAPKSNGARDYQRLAVEMFGADFAEPRASEDADVATEVPVATTDRPAAKGIEPEPAPAPVVVRESSAGSNGTATARRRTPPAGRVPMVPEQPSAPNRPGSKNGSKPHVVEAVPTAAPVATSANPAPTTESPEHRPQQA